jgi:hypothetical protein
MKYHMNTRHSARILALDITGKGIAYAYLEGPDKVESWGTAYVEEKSEDSYLARAEELYYRHEPNLLVIEDRKSPLSKKGKRAKAVLREIESFASSRHLPVFRVSRKDVRLAFPEASKNKYQTAQAIAFLLPELEDDLPDVRRPWEAEKDRIHIFDAVTFALTAYRSPEKLEEIQN